MTSNDALAEAEKARATLVVKDSRSKAIYAMDVPNLKSALAAFSTQRQKALLAWRGHHIHRDLCSSAIMSKSSRYSVRRNLFRVDAGNRAVFVYLMN